MCSRVSFTSHHHFLLHLTNSPDNLSTICDCTSFCIGDTWRQPSTPDHTLAVNQSVPQNGNWQEYCASLANENNVPSLRVQRECLLSVTHPPAAAQWQEMSVPGTLCRLSRFTIKTNVKEKLRESDFSLNSCHQTYHQQKLVKWRREIESRPQAGSGNVACFRYPTT